MDSSQSTNNRNWNPGTWIVLMLILLAGSFISSYLKNFTDSLLLYLPTSLAFVMVHWFGPRILPLAFINGFVTLFLWNAPGGWDRLFVFATREPVIVFVSWYLCKDLIVKSKGLTSTQTFSRFTLFGIVLPDVVNSFYTYHYSFIGGDMEKVGLLWLSDFITTFSVAVPLLHYFKPVQTRVAFKLVPNEIQSFTQLNYKAIAEIIIITVLYLVIGFFISFDKYWFIYGVTATFIAVRHGFCYVTLINSIIFLFNYIIPLINFGSWEYSIGTSTQLVNVHLGMTSMFFGSALIGRVISDLRNSEESTSEQKKQLEMSNEELRKTNQDLDRFVYSVSHDISAPLKSIRGLISIGKLEQTNNVNFPYIDKIEQSIQKLEDFSEEILAHSKASRKNIQLEEIDLNKFSRDIVDNLYFLDGFGHVSFEYNFSVPVVITDRFILKVVLSNLISNAIKFQRKTEGHKALVSIKSYAIKDQLFIEVMDNGYGIDEKYKLRIFEMFYRATDMASGSGLGLYIAKEAIEKLSGGITLQTKNGEGSIFTIHLPLIKKEEIQTLTTEV